MTLLEELNHILDTWGETPEGVRLVVMDKTALPATVAVLTKLRLLIPRDFEQIDGPTLTWEEYFEKYTKGWTTDYAFILRYEYDDIAPRVVAVVQRDHPHTATWVYLTGGVGAAQNEICAGEMMEIAQRPRGIIRNLLFHVGIRFIECYCKPGGAMERGARTAGYQFQMQPDGMLKGVLRLKKEDYDCVHLHPVRIVPTGASVVGEDVRCPDEAHFPFQSPDTGPGGSLAGVDQG